MTSLSAFDSPDLYTIAWIAALPIERAAAEAMLNEKHAAPTGFTRHQTWGRVGEHNIVIAPSAIHPCWSFGGHRRRHRPTGRGPRYPAR